MQKLRRIIKFIMSMQCNNIFTYVAEMTDYPFSYLLMLQVVVPPFPRVGSQTTTAVGNVFYIDIRNGNGLHI